MNPSHHHHQHAHHHTHSHGPLEAHPRGSLSLSLLRMSVAARLGGATALAGVLWLAILWALR
jgi:hypothetical protein